MFNNDDQSNKQESPAPDNSLFGDQLKTIVNESGNQKYDDVNTALSALKSSQEFIPKLEDDNKTLRSELDTLKAELEKRSSVEDVVSKLLNKEDKPLEQTQETPSSSALDTDSVKQILSSLLQEEKAQSTSSTNKEKVKQGFIEKYGDTAGTKFGEMAKEAGMSTDELESLAAKSPSLVLQLIPKTNKGPSVSTGGFNSSVFTATGDDSGDIKPASQSVLAGATARDLSAEMARHKEAVYKKHNVTI